MTPISSEKKKQFAKFQQEASYQSKVDLVKVKLTELNKVQLAESLVQTKEEKDALEEQVYDVNVRLEAMYQLLNEQLDDEGITSFKLPNGRPFWQQADVYVKVEDSSLFYPWLKAQPGGEDFFTVNYQTSASLTKSMIERGEAVPPGLGVYIKHMIKTRKV